MRISINTLSVTNDHEGIRTVLLGLIPALIRLDEVNRYRLITSSANSTMLSGLAGRVDTTLIKQKRSTPVARIFHDQVTVPWIVRHDTDLLFSIASVGSVVAQVPEVVLVQAHMALASVRAEAGGPQPSLSHRVYYGPMMRLSHRRASEVVTFSRFLRDRLVAEHGLQASKVHAISAGLDITEVPRVVGSVHRGRPYVLFVSTLYPYKNAEAVIRGLASALPRLPSAIDAIIVGRDPDGNQIPALRRVADELSVASCVSFTGKISDEERDRLYAGATAVAFPSRAEGFGFAALEAMARGVPVIVSNRASLPEVVGDAALIVDPEQPETLGDALVRLAGDQGLRSRLIAAGLARARELTWDETAVNFIALFTDVQKAALRSGPESGGPYDTRSNTA